MNKRKMSIKISFNSPVILAFVAVCFATFLLDKITGGIANRVAFSVYRSSLLSPLTYLRFIGHIFGHANWEHLIGNMTMILLVGPLLEEKYGSVFMIEVIGVTAVVTGLIHFIIFPHTGLLGASGVVFALILLSSLTGIEEGKIPATFILVAAIYIGGQIYDGILVRDNVSNLTHIVGGAVGGFMGCTLNKVKILSR